jgi:ABC-type sugar transport system permease subunit
MDPNSYPHQPEQQNQPVQQPVQPGKTSGRTKLALWLMIGPTLLIILAFVGYAILNLATSSMTEPSANCDTSSQRPLDNEGSSSDAPCDLFTDTSPAQSIGNILLYLVGAIAFLTWLPGLITGIVLLATRPKSTA